MLGEVVIQHQAFSTRRTLMKLIDGNDTEASDIYSVFDNRDASQEAGLKLFVITYGKCHFHLQRNTYLTIVTQRS
jgi:hypothetical protein